jgi:hypothetical protein
LYGAAWEDLIREKLEAKTGEFDQILQKIANAVASGALSEKLTPQGLLEKTENHVNHLSDLVTSAEEPMLLLKPEKANTIKAKRKNLNQTLTTFKDILHQNTMDPLANSRLAFEQLRKGLTDSSDFLSLMREARDNPSPLMSAILTFKKASETKSSAMNMRASDGTRPTIEYVLSLMNQFRIELTGLEKKVGEMKQTMRELREESLRMLSCKTSERPEPAENKTEKRQLSLSSFKVEQN